MRFWWDSLVLWLPMQTLGLTPTRRTDGRIKSLFWPTVGNDVDVDYLTAQGFWVCFLVATITLAASILSGTYLAGGVESLFYYLGGIGVRQRSRVAAVSIFVAYTLAGFVLARYSAGSFGIGRVIFMALLLANVRAVWLAANWRRIGETDESPIRMSDTLSDKISDRLPPLIWPRARLVFYLFALLEVGFLILALFAPMPQP
jgi:hypothetical protein